MSKARNITLSIDEAILKEARVIAAERGLSVSAFLRQELIQLVEAQRGYGKARQRAVARLQRGTPLGAGRAARREDLHDRAKLR